ncbi:hypothetical protein K438DRAFT_226576 [Mycena galopus ATCC 62051]|nr:hypothetical protein K438DRAFT_226576 [Mycena galopus ATCC 62051]
MHLASDVRPAPLCTASNPQNSLLRSAILAWPFTLALAHRVLKLPPRCYPCSSRTASRKFMQVRHRTVPAQAPRRAGEYSAR